jgi:hypothetical protein
MHCGDTVAPLLKDREISCQQAEVKKEKTCTITFGDWECNQLFPAQKMASRSEILRLHSISQD